MRELNGTPLSGMQSLREGYERVRRQREIQRDAEAAQEPAGKDEEGNRSNRDSTGAGD